jgi:hypothetical protein
VKAAAFKIPRENGLVYRFQEPWPQRTMHIEGCVENLSRDSILRVPDLCHFKRLTEVCLASLCGLSQSMPHAMTQR